MVSIGTEGMFVKRSQWKECGEPVSQRGFARTFYKIQSIFILEIKEMNMGFLFPYVIIF